MKSNKSKMILNISQKCFSTNLNNSEIHSDQFNNILSDKRPIVTIVGTFQQGKSTLVNCLLDGYYSPIGEGLTTTKNLFKFSFGEAEEVRLIRELGGIETLESKEILFNSNILKNLNISMHDIFEITCWKPLLLNSDLIDTPGFNSNDEDSTIALSGINSSDLLVVLLGGKDIGQTELKLFDQILLHDKTFIVLYNCLDQNPDPADPNTTDICSSISAKLTVHGLKPLKISGLAVWPCNLLWAWHAMGHLSRDSYNQNGLTPKNSSQKIKKINEHFRLEKSNSIKPLNRDLLSMSKFLPIRTVIESYPSQFSSLGFAQKNFNLLKKAEKLWDSELRKQLNKIT